MKSGSLLGLFLHPRVHGQCISQLSVYTALFSFTPHFKASCHFVNTFHVLAISFESVLNLAYILWERRYTPWLADLHFAHYRISEATTIVTLWPSLGCLDMIGCEICCGRWHARDHTLSCTGQGVKGPWHNCSELFHLMPFSWWLKKYTLNTYNCPKSHSPAIKHVPLAASLTQASGVARLYMPTPLQGWGLQNPLGSPWWEGLQLLPVVVGLLVRSCTTVA